MRKWKFQNDNQKTTLIYGFVAEFNLRANTSKIVYISNDILSFGHIYPC